MKLNDNLIVKICLFILMPVLFVQCGKLNPEDPKLPHFRHLNERLAGEWELEKIYVDQNDSSAYLDIDSMNIARFFKFVPTKNTNDLEGRGNLFIKSSAMNSFPNKIGISRSLIRDLNDTNMGHASINYKFREGDSFFQFDFQEIVADNSLDDGYPIFKPIGKDFIINNFYIKPFWTFAILKATNKKFILGKSIQIEQNNPYSEYKRFRLEFKKIK